jgi:general secretion pathway protein E
LLRVLCERCRLEQKLSAASIAADPRYEMLGFQVGDQIYEPVGCERCSGTGYRGRTGVFEVLEVTDEVRNLIGSRSASGTIMRVAKPAGMTTMFEHAIAKCRAGVTSAVEVLRVTTAR